ncbi:MAG: coenzyme F420-0:L-glutamate ligase [Candidatus Levyibacteriota bacterium]
MQVKSYKTHKITRKDTDIFRILDGYLPKAEENSVVAVTSKIIAICEGRLVPVGSKSKDELVREEADYFIPKEKNQYGVYLTIKDNLLVATAGIDESNADNNYIMWPENPQKTANEIRVYLKKKNSVKNLGVIITDSKSTMLRWGITGASIAHSGFAALNNKIGTPDIFGKKLDVTQVNVSDALASAAVLEMGEANEQTPLAIITDIPYVEFQDRNPTEEELSVFHYELEKDMYSILLNSAPWEEGNKKS